MASKRMFSKDIVDTDEFITLSHSAQVLYFHLSMNADDDGFVSNVLKTIRVLQCSQQDLNDLIGFGFLIPFPSGVMVITHWKINNFLRNDRYKETIYLAEKSQLSLDESKRYTIGIPNGHQSKTTGIPRVDEYKQVEMSINKCSQDDIPQLQTSPAHSLNKISYGSAHNVFLTIEEYTNLKQRFPNQTDAKIEYFSGYLERKNNAFYPDHYKTLSDWLAVDVQKEKQALNNQRTGKKDTFRTMQSRDDVDFDAIERRNQLKLIQEQNKSTTDAADQMNDIPFH